MDYLKSIISLLDDTNKATRDSAITKLKSYGSELEILTVDIWDSIDASVKPELNKIIKEIRRDYVLSNWSAWEAKNSEAERIEYALGLISVYVGGFVKVPFTLVLDQIAKDFKKEYPTFTAFELSEYLFQNLKFRGGDETKNELNLSNMNYVALTKTGLPISLCLIFILVGKRLGLHITGVNYPNHFLARFIINNDVYLVDCYHQGRTVDVNEVSEFNYLSQNQIENWLHANSTSIIRRVLHNCLSYYKKNKLKDEEKDIRALLTDIRDYRNFMRKARSLVDQGIKDKLFEPGKCVCHKKYGYRGVIVHFDDECKANDDWYFSNQTQPDRLQPWYHILVDDTNSVTYAAQSNLELDQSHIEVKHPLLKKYFKSFSNGEYDRNKTAWENKL